MKISKYPLSDTDLSVTFTSETEATITSVYGSYNPDADLPTDDELLEWLAGDVYLYQEMHEHYEALENFFVHIGLSANEASQYARQVRSSYGFYLDCTKRERDHMNFLVSDLDNSDGAEL